MYKPLVSSAPAHSILNAQAFHYTSSVETDIRKTFARVRRRRAKANPSISVASNVRPFIKKEPEMPPPDAQNKAPGDHVSNTCNNGHVRALASGPPTMTVLANVWPMRRAHACRHFVSAGPAPILHSVDPRTLCADASARLNTISRCSPPKPSAVADASVWLECNGELIDVRSVDVLRIPEATPGIELIEFVCPRCRTPHASLRFG